MAILPKLRGDLLVSEDLAGDGARWVVLKDPVSEKFFRLSAHEYLFLQLFNGNITLEEALDKFKAGGRYYSLEEGRTLLARASELGLMLGTAYGTAQFQARVLARTEEAKKAKLLSSIYFLFIPLWNPDDFLEKTLWLFRALANKWSLRTFAVLTPGAVYFVIDGMQRIEREVLYFFNLENLLLLWFTIALTKLVHELAHAYAAKAMGLRVPRIGVAFLIFFPCLYCDTTDAWQLADRRQRMIISAAGVIAEGALAIISTYIWHYSRPGMINSLAFYLMAVSFVSTVLFNGNPLMKFDGYFILIDQLGIPNLQAKAFQYLRYLFMNRVLGMARVNSPADDRRERSIFTVYGISAAVYRVFLYTGIVAGVYYRFDKSLGLALAILAFSLFIVRPVFRGVKTLNAGKSEINLQPAGSAFFLAVLAAAVLVLLIPVSTRSRYPCYVSSAEVQKLTVPLQTSIARVHVRQGDSVKSGTVLYELDASVLNLALMKVESRRNIIMIELETTRLDSRQRGKAPGKEVELYQAEEEVSRIKEELRRAREGMVAPFDGVVTALDHRVQPGFRPGEGAVVGELQSQAHCLVQALVPEQDRHKLRLGQQVEMWFPERRGRTVVGRIESVKPYNERDLRDSPFSSRLGGELATEFKGEHHKDAPLEAQYRCTARFADQGEKVPLGMTGIFVLFSPPQSLFSRFVNSVYRTFHRESLI